MHALAGYIIAFIGAGIGGAMRHGVNVATLRLLSSDFPYGTLFINVVGSLVMGLLAACSPSSSIQGSHGDCSSPRVSSVASRRFPHFRSKLWCSMSVGSSDQ